jgi:hypothetical protein
MKSTFYFAHDYNAGQDYKIIALISKHSASGYGVYWRIIEMLHSDDSHTLPNNEMIWSVISMTMNTPIRDIQSIIETCLEYKLLCIDADGLIYSNRVNYNIGYREQIHKNKVDGGKKSADKRKQMLNNSSTNNEHNVNSSSTAVQQEVNKVKESKVKESKVKNIIFSPDFEIIWSNYGKVGSKQKAFEIWKKMNDEKQDKIAKSISGYLNHLQKTGYSQKHFTTYLNSDEYENYLNISTSAGGEVKVEVIKVLPNFANGYNFSLWGKIPKGTVTAERWQWYRENRAECSEVYQHCQKLRDRDQEEYLKLGESHPLMKFIKDYIQFVTNENNQ